MIVEAPNPVTSTRFGWCLAILSARAAATLSVVVTSRRSYLGGRPGSAGQLSTRADHQRTSEHCCLCMFLRVLQHNEQHSARESCSKSHLQSRSGCNSAHSSLRFPWLFPQRQRAAGAPSARTPRGPACTPRRGAPGRPPRAGAPPRGPSDGSRSLPGSRRSRWSCPPGEAPAATALTHVAPTRWLQPAAFLPPKRRLTRRVSSGGGGQRPRRPRSRPR